jgi:hypothetical protein
MKISLRKNSKVAEGICMKTYFKSYWNTYLDERDETLAFTMITDGEKYGIAFPAGFRDESIEDMRAVIGSRIYATKKINESANPGEILNSIPYNWMFLNASEEDDVYPTWETAVNEMEIITDANKVYGFPEWEFKLLEPLFPSLSESDHQSEQKVKNPFSPENLERPQDLICYCDPDTDQAITIFYDSADGLFYRDQGQWKVISDDDDWEFDLDGTISFFVDPSFIPIYDEADMMGAIVPIEIVAKYELIGKETIQE